MARRGGYVGAITARFTRRAIPAALIAAAVSACNALPPDWGVPQAPTSGAIGYTMQTRGASNQEREWTHQATGTVTGSSYIWQPWFATTSATLRLTEDRTSGGGGDSRSSGFASGDFTVAALPQSRFPTTLSYAREDSRVDTAGLGIDYTTDRVSLNNYLFLADGWSASSGLAYENTDFSDGGNDQLRSADVRVAKVFETQSMELSLRHDDSELETVERRKNTDRTSLATFRHLYSPLRDVNVQSSTTMMQQTGEFQDFSRNAFSIQGVSTTQWRPAEQPFTVNGAARTLTQSADLRTPTGGGFDSDTTLFSGVVGLNYPLGPQLTANAGVTANYQSIDTRPRNVAVTRTQTSVDAASLGLLGGVNYYSLPTPLAGFDYTWNAAANALAQFANDDSLTNQSVATTLGHALSRTLDAPFVGPVYLSLGESGNVSFASAGGATYGLSHVASVTHDFGDAAARTLAQATATDSREFGEFESTYQIGTLQVNHVSAIDLDRSWAAGLSVQTYRIAFNNVDAGWRTALNGNGNYTERNFFDVRNLTFRSTVILNAVGFGEVVETRRDRRIRDEFRSQWINRFDYQIGRLLIGLEGRVFRDNDRIGDLVRLQIVRLF